MSSEPHHCRTLHPAGPLHALAALVTTLLASLLVVGVSAPTAHAHTELVESWPAAGPTDRPVDAVRLRFVEPLAAGLAQVAVTGPRGSVASGDPVVTGREVVVPLRPLTRAGTYSVAFRVVAADGHSVVGDLDVVVTATSAAAAAASVAAADAAAARKSTAKAADTTTPSTGPEEAGSASRGSRSGAPDQHLPVGSGAPVTSGGLDPALTGGGIAAVLLLLALHLVLRRGVDTAGRAR